MGGGDFMAGVTPPAGATARHLGDLFGGGSSAVGLDDGQLLARYSATGDASAFEALVARHGPMVLATARSVLRREHDVEDAFQATFLVLARKAGSVRAGDALGGWLHRVARRSAVQASVEARRRKDREGGPAAALGAVAGPAPTGPDFDLRAIVHEEVDRLPEGRRLPVVLCDLEGLTYEEAARRLRWTVPTLRNRLAKARRNLKDRLARRGVTGPALAIGPMPAVPEAMARAAIRAATGGASASAGAAAITSIILKGMLMTKIKIGVTAALAFTALATARVVAVGKIGPGPAPPAKAAAVVPEAAREGPSPAPTGPVEVVEVRGVVVGPDGKPVGGAILRPAYYDDEVRPAPEARSGPDGRFLIRVLRTARQASMLGGSDSFPWLVASAPGFGPGRVLGIFQAKAKGQEQTVRLVEGGPPIEGRIVDLEGRPVAGARVKVERFNSAEGDLSPWIAKARDGGVDGIWRNLDQLPFTAEATTGPDGRFLMEGGGRDRIAELLVSGPTIATARLFVLGRDETEIRTVDRSWVEPRPLVIHAPKFEHAVAPAKIIGGVVRDKNSGRPIAGAKIRGMVFEESSMVSAPGVEATTDAEGRYRLSGLARGDAYRLFVEPAKGQPYLNASFKVPADTPALEPVTFDVAMKHGILVRGRLTDKATGKPASGYVNAYCFNDNPHLGEFPGYSASYPPQAEIREDGRYEVVALPGRGIIAARGSLALYRGGLGAEAIKGFDPKRRTFPTVPHYCNVGNYHILAEVDLDPKADSATLDLQVDPGRSLTITAVDPEGRPIGETRVSGLTDLFASVDYPQESPTIEVHALDPSKPRRVTASHAGRKLVGSVFLKGDEPGPMTLKLQPWGAVAGRIVDDEGRPHKGMALTSAEGTSPDRPEINGILPGTTWGNGLQLGGDGRFRVEGLVPGLKYGAGAHGDRMSGGTLFRDLTVAPGEVKDLGDLKLIPPKRDGQE